MSDDSGAAGGPAGPSAPGRTLTFGLKLAYGVGEMGEGLKTAALETFLFFFYVQVVGLSGALTGLALLVALLCDGLSDPLVGAWSDRTRSRLGRRHPFLYLAPAPLALALVALFSPPSLPQGLLFLWLTGFTVAARFAMTLYFVPHMALGAELSGDFHDRISLGGFRTLFGYLGRMLALALAFGVFFPAAGAASDGQLDRGAYTGLALALGIGVAISVIGSALATQGAALRLRVESPQRPRLEPAGRLRMLRVIAGSPSLRALFLSLLVMYSYNGVQGALALHMNTYFWRLAPREVQLVLYASMLGFILGIPLAKPAARLWDKKTAYVLGVAASVLTGCAPTLLRLAGLGPANGDPSLVPLLVGASAAAGFLGAVPVVLSAAMLADVSDEAALALGRRTEGLLFGANAFCRKASLGVGGAIAGMTIDLIGFPKGADALHANPDALMRLGLAYGPVMLGVLFGGLALMSSYAMDRRRHDAILAALAGREPRA